jgi:hypothetical protein
MKNIGEIALYVKEKGVATYGAFALFGSAGASDVRAWIVDKQARIEDMSLSRKGY